MEDQQSFPTFQAYFEARTGKAFEEWGQLEQTYAYVFAFKPHLIDGLYATAKKAALAQQNQASDSANSSVKHGGDRKSVAYHEIKRDTNINDVTLDNRGTSRTYALRRLSRSPDEAHQALYQRCLAGELTAHAAMVQAGFRKRPASRAKTPLERLHLAWSRVATAERLHFLREILTPAERHALLAEESVP
jgi:hypothetical protein